MIELLSLSYSNVCFQQENEQLSNKMAALEGKLDLQGKEIKAHNLEVHQDNMSMKYIPLYTPLLYSKTGGAILLIFDQNIDCGYSLEPPHRGSKVYPPHRGGSNVYPQSTFKQKYIKVSFFADEIIQFVQHHKIPYSTWAYY